MGATRPMGQHVNANPPTTTAAPPAEVTVRAVVLGLVLAVVLGAANTYLGLYAGMTVSASIPAAVVSMAILRGLLRTGTILENNMVSTLASTGESLAAGVIFTVPALVLVGAWQEFEFWPTTLIAMLGGLLGVIFMIPLRRAMIVERPDLTYPEGVACAEVLRAGDAGGRGLGTISIGVLIGGLVKALVEGAGLVRGALEGAFASGRSLFYAGTYVSPALIAVGYIVKLRVAAQVFLGGALMWFVALPILGGFEGADALAAAKATGASSIRYIGVGAMLVGGVASIWNVRRGILGGVRAMRGFGSAAGGAVARTDRDMPFTALVVLFTLSVLGVFALYEFLLDSQLAAIASTLVMVAAAFLFVAVATYIVGLVGSSNSPVSGMTICALLLASGVMLAVGVRGESAMFAVLGVAGVVCCAACTSGDIAQDLKTGQLVGATPANQQWMQVISVIVPAFVFAPILTVLHENGGIGEKFQAPQATLFASLTQGLFGNGELPPNLVYIGAAIGLAMIAINFVLARAKKSIRFYLMPVAVGMYLPMTVTTPILIGGLLHWIVNRGRQERATDPGVLLGSGMIAGEALVGIGLAAAAPSGVFPLADSASGLLTVGVLVILLGLYARFARSNA
jgi:putative OPT family oligopeptide transporter